MKRKVHPDQRANRSHRYVRDYPAHLLWLYPQHPKQFSLGLAFSNSRTD